MQSKTSSINKELLIYIFRSSGWISLLYLIGLLFALPLEVLMSVLEERAIYVDGPKLLIINNTIQYALILVIPVLLAVFLFRFLQVKQLADFIHSLPLSRKQIYVHHLVAGIVFLLFPILITAFILLVFQWTLDVSQIYTIKEIGSWMGITFSIELLIFSVAVLIGMITGLSALQAVLTYVMLLLPVGLVVLFVVNIKFLLFGFSENYYLTSNIWRLSPLTAVAELNKVKLFSVYFLVYYILSVCLLLLSFLLYKKRKHEYVSHAFVFPVLKPVFKYGMITGVMLLSGFYFSQTTEPFGWMIFGYVIGAVFGYLLAEMVLQKTWRTKLQLKGFGYYVLVMLACVVLIKLDFIGFEKKVPDTADIKKVSISKIDTNYSDDQMNTDYDTNQVENPFVVLTEDQNKVTLRKLHEQIIERGESERFVSDRENPTPSIFIKYELENGRNISREYFLRNYDSFSPYLKKIYESKEYKERAYSLLKSSSRDVYRVDISSNGPFNKSIQLSDPKQIKEAIEALQADLVNKTYEQMADPVGEVGYLTVTLEKNRSIHFSWLASFQHFNKWMKQTGKEDRVRIQAVDIDYLMIQEYKKGVDYYSPDFVQQQNALKIEKGDQVDSLLALLSPNVEGKYVVAFHYKGNPSIEVRGLSAELAPDYIIKHFKK